MANQRIVLRERIADHCHRVREVRKRVKEELGMVGMGPPKRTNVRLLRKPTNDDLVLEWQTVLGNSGLSQAVIQRKVKHLRKFVQYLESDDKGEPRNLLDVDERALETYLFRTYICHWPVSKTEAERFPLDLRDFYRYQEKLGRIPDSRFVELMHRMRGLILERMELHYEILGYPEEFDELYKKLFFG